MLFSCVSFLNINKISQSKKFPLVGLFVKDLQSFFGVLLWGFPSFEIGLASLLCLVV